MKKTDEFDGLTVHGLIADDDFIRWVCSPDEKLDRQWKSVCEHNEANARVVAEAREIVQAVKMEAVRPSAQTRTRVFERIKSEISENESQPLVRRLWSHPLLRIAAAILVVGIIGMWLYIGKKDVSFPANNMALDTGNGVIYLNDGRTLSFDDLVVGVSSDVEGTLITKESGNRLVYGVGGSPAGTATAYASGLKSPAGAVWEVALPDGSTAFLNAQSTLRFATANFGEQRRLSLEGEAYFEVVHDADRPFTVKVGEVDVTVLGTDFVVSGYENSTSVNVALVDGSVRVKHDGGEAVVLVPGEQAHYGAGDVEPQVSDASLEQVLAWKNGLFSFEGESIDQVMQVLSHWYNVAVAYEGKKPTKGITGTIPNDSSLEDVLAILTDTGLDADLSLVGDTIVVKGN